MGWSVGDDKHVEQARINLSRLKSAVYDLRKNIESIGHEEKKQPMLAALTDIDESVYVIDLTLVR